MQEQPQPDIAMTIITAASEGLSDRLAKTEEGQKVLDVVRDTLTQREVDPATTDKIVKIIADNALKAFGDTSGIGDLKPLAQDIVKNLKAAKVCFTINVPGLPPKTQHVSHLGELQTAAWVPSSQVR